MADDEEVIDEGAAAEDSGAETEEIQAEKPSKSRRMLVPSGVYGAPSKPDVWTALLIVAFSAFLIGLFLSGSELRDYYDVQFWLLSKK